MNHWVGFSGLNLCGPKGWKRQVDVCLPLLAAVNKTEDPDSPTEAQENNCAFASVRVERLDRPAPKCTPHDGTWSATVEHSFFHTLSFVCCVQRASSQIQIWSSPPVASMNSVSKIKQLCHCAILVACCVQF